MPARKKSARKKYWSAEVTNNSRALELEYHVFLRSPKEIALSLKRSAERSTQRKSSPFRSAMSMLNFYINRAGRNLPEAERKKLERAKTELRIVFGRE